MAYATRKSIARHSQIAKQREPVCYNRLMVFYDMSVEEVLRHFKVEKNRGLTPKQVARARAKFGPNTLSLKGTPLWKILLQPFLDVFMFILLGALVLTLIQGEHLEAILIGVIILINIAIYYVQQFSTSRIIRSLKKQVAQEVEVRRSGHTSRVPIADLVPGDIISLREGEKVPADCRIIAEAVAQVDESILTGESEHLHKQTKKLGKGLEIYERSNMLFSGSFVVAGSATAVVVATGSATEFGRIANLARDGADKHVNPVQQKISRLIKYVAIAVGILAAVVLALEIYRGSTLPEAIKFVLAMTVSAIPEGLPIAISVILALGMRRMAKKKALVTNMRAIETIGAINTICTDKTGTLTENKLAVTDTWTLPNQRNLLTFAMRCAIIEGEADPLDAALLEFIGPRGDSVNDFSWSAALPFDQKAAMSGNLWQNQERSGQFVLAVKGAPETILAHCDLAARAEAAANQQLAQLTKQGYRVIALAVAKLDHKISSFGRLPKSDFQFAGLIAVADRLRTESAHSLAVARRAGVSVRMITGDHFNTAFTIGKKLGLVKNANQVMDCHELEVLDDDALARAIEDIYVFSRVTPEQKFRLLRIFERQNITAMTGDGVNDVPALAQAHVGIAMGSSPSIVRDAGDMILLDDNFTNINAAMREGRTIVENIKRMLIYLLATNAGEVLIIVAALVSGVPLPLLPIQILWVNLVTDSCLTVPLGLEKAEANVMTRAPRPSNAPLLSPVMIGRMILMAVAMTLLTFGVYLFFGSRLGWPAAGTLAFLALIVAQIANAFSLRSNYESIWKRLRVFSLSMLIGLSISVTTQVLAFTTPLRAMLHIQAVPLPAMLGVIGVSLVVPVLALELHKYFFSRRKVV